MAAIRFPDPSPDRFGVPGAHSKSKKVVSGSCVVPHELERGVCDGSGAVRGVIFVGVFAVFSLVDVRERFVGGDSVEGGGQGGEEEKEKEVTERRRSHGWDLGDKLGWKWVFIEGRRPLMKNSKNSCLWTSEVLFDAVGAVHEVLGRSVDCGAKDVG